MENTLSLGYKSQDGYLLESASFNQQGELIQHEPLPIVAWKFLSHLAIEHEMPQIFTATIAVLEDGREISYEDDSDEIVYAVRVPEHIGVFGESYYSLSDTANPLTKDEWAIEAARILEVFAKGSE